VIHLNSFLNFFKTNTCAVGTNVGDIGIWEVGSREKLAQRTFKVWDITVASMPMQVVTFAPGLLLCSVTASKICFSKLVLAYSICKLKQT
jgi:hypothetical protein